MRNGNYQSILSVAQHLLSFFWRILERRRRSVRAARREGQVEPQRTDAAVRIVALGVEPALVGVGRDQAGDKEARDFRAVGLPEIEDDAIAIPRLVVGEAALAGEPGLGDRLGNERPAGEADDGVAALDKGIVAAVDLAREERAMWPKGAAAKAGGSSGGRRRGRRRRAGQFQ